VRTRWVLLTAIASTLMLSCYGLMGRADAYLVGANWKFSRPNEPQELWQVGLSYWKNFCSIENTRVGAYAAIRSDDTYTESVDSSLLWNVYPNAVRFERGYLAPPFVLIFFRWREGVARSLQRVVWPPTLRARELAGIDGVVDKLFKPLVPVLVVCDIYARNAIDHIHGGNLANIAAAQFYKKHEAFFLPVGSAGIEWVYGYLTDEARIQGQPRPEISVSDFLGVSQHFGAFCYGCFRRFCGVTRNSNLLFASFPESVSGEPQSESEYSDHDGGKGVNCLPIVVSPGQGAICMEKNTRGRHENAASLL
jgi:hypothetical protein